MDNQESSIETYCRLCSKCFSSGLSPLFDSSSILFIQYNFTKKLKMKLTQGDELPQNVCKMCHFELQKVQLFIEKCEISQDYLESIFRHDKFFDEEHMDFKVLDEDVKDEIFDDEISNQYGDVFQEVNKEVSKVSTKLKIEKLNDKVGDNGKEVKEEEEEEYIYYNLETYSSDSNEEIIKLKKKNESLGRKKKNESLKRKMKDELLGRKKKTLIKEDKQIIKEKEAKVCSECGDFFKSLNELRVHKKESHEKVKLEPQSFLCDHCGKEFTKKSSLKDHMNSHSGIKPYKCEICGKSFSIKNAFRAHFQKHTKKESYTCNTCNKSFTTKSFYNEHMKRHENGTLSENNEKPFKCPHCIKSFKLLATLTAHCQFHNKTSDKKYQCKDCGTTFKRSDHLKEHINGVHLKIFPFKCGICLKAFVTGAIRNAHVRKFHSGSRFKCNLCDKDFSLAASLRRHKRVHSGEKPFVCEICNMSFVAVYQIEKHMETHKIDESTKMNLISQTYEEITKTVVNAKERFN